MKTKITILFFVLALKSFSQTPQYNWVNSYGKITINISTTDVLGNEYFSGALLGTTTFGTYTLTGIGNYITKISNTGEVMWAKKLPGNTFSMISNSIHEGKNLVADSIGNVYLGGYYVGSLTIDYITVVDTIFPEDYCLIKFDLLGNAVWIKSMASPTFLGTAPHLQYINDNKILVLGVFYSEIILDENTSLTTNVPEGNNPFIAAYNTDGELINSIQLDPIITHHPWQVNRDEEVFVDNDGSIFRSLMVYDSSYTINGIVYTTDTVRFEINDYGDTIFYGEYTYYLPQTYVIAKYNEEGSILWHKLIKHAALPPIIASDNENGLYFLGLFGRNYIIVDSDTLYNSASPSNGYPSGTMDNFLIRFDPDGNIIWSLISPLAYYGEYYNDLKVDLIGNAYFTELKVAGFGSTGSLKKVSPIGELQWEKNIVTSVNHNFFSNSPDNKGNLYFSGDLLSYITSEQAQFDSISLTIPPLINQTVFSRIGNCNMDAPSVTLGSTEICANENTTLTCSASQSYLWSNGDTTQSITINTAGAYSVFAIDSLGCFAKSLDQEIVVNPLPSVAVTADQNTLTANLSGAEYQWIDCFNENQMIEGATNQSFTTDINGSYAVIISSNGECTDTSECYIINESGLNDVLESNSIQVYPNPANDLIRIKLSKDQKLNIQKVIVKNVLGQIIFSQNKFVSTIDISNFSKGVYNLEVFSNRAIWQGQFVKE